MEYFCGGGLTGATQRRSGSPDEAKRDPGRCRTQREQPPDHASAPSGHRGFAALYHLPCAKKHPAVSRRVFVHVFR
ncbi:hypothetical protein BSZ22_03940 [Bradyrhizobium canariense]|nr:hypothetical protein BSZ22_03940 [Bradyrhizobium canariense]